MFGGRREGKLLQFAAAEKPAIRQRLYSNCEGEGCWQWMGAVNKDGYPVVRIGGRLYLAHRVSFAVFKRYVPSRVDVHHEKCKTRNCINPYHLRLLGHVANVVEANTRRGKNDKASKKV